MAKLTRTQKYAALRDELANDKETNYVSQDLSSYVNRFNDVQENLAPKTVVTPVEEKVKPDYIWQPFEQEQEPVKTFVEPIVEQKIEEVKPVVQETVKPVIEEVKTVIEEQVKPIVEEIQPVVEPTVEEIKEVVEEIQPVVEQKIEEVKPVVQETVAQAAPAQNDSYFDAFMADTPSSSKIDVNDFNSFFEEENVEEEKKDEFNLEDTFKGVFEDVEDTTDDSISKKERDTYLNQTISDVNFHNIVNGEKTLDDIVDNAVDEIRHPELENKPIEPVIEETAEEIVDNTYAWPSFEDANKELDADEPVKQEEPVVTENNPDEEFSNTVSVEISKIMDSMAAPEETKVEEPVQETIEEIVEEKQVEPAPVKVEPVEEKAEEVVEIKNINELKDEPLKNTVSGTIPFVVNTDDEEDIEDDEEEEEGSNTILNIILIVLIIVLVAVLGLIVFYILKTKGIF